MVVVAGLCFVATLLGLLFLEETLDRKKVAERKARAAAAVAEDRCVCGAV
jgi:hypothetical protein